MSRTYRIVLTIEGAFARKVNAKREAERLLARLDVRKPWMRMGTRVSSRRVVPPASPKPPSEADVFRTTVIAQARRAVDELRAANPNLPRVTVRWVHEGGCDSNRGGHRAHAHPGKWWARREGGKRVSLPRNLICLVAPWNIRREATGTMDRFGFEKLRKVLVPLTDETMRSLMAHEIAHMKFTSRTHRSKAFHESVERAIARTNGEVVA